MELKKNYKKTQQRKTPSKHYLDLKTQWAALARIDYSFYCEYVHQGLYTHAKHTELICQHLQAVEEGRIKRLMVFMPPRHSKSNTITETFPSYFIGKNPKRRVMAISYASELAEKFGRSNRRKVENYGPEIFNIELSGDNKSVTNWGIEGQPGGMLSAGIGGGLTGHGANLLLIDDPIKNRREAESVTYREFLWNEWQNSYYTRLAPGGAIIIVLTRWHEDDLAGRILSNPEYNKDWTVLSLPAEAEENDLLGREEGAPLWPEFGFDLTWLQDTKKAVGSRTWASLYQQRPAPGEGAIFKRQWFKFYREAPTRFDEVIQSWDMTFKNNEGNDYVAGHVWGRIGAEKYLLDRVHARLEFTETLQAVRTLSAKWPIARAKLIEDKANGPAVISVLKKEISGIIPVEPDGGKEARAQAASVDLEAGNVYFPDPSIAPWVHDVIEEFASFPAGKHDDDVDAYSQAMNRFTKRKAIKPVAKPKGM